MTRAKRFWPAILALFAAAFFIVRNTLNQNVLDDATSSVSGSVTSLMLCEAKSDRIPTKCAPLADDKKEQAITAIRRAQKADPPGHCNQQSAYVLKIVESGDGEGATTKCFSLIECAGFESDLYLRRIRTGKNCSGETFKVVGGSIRLENFLRSGNP
jgi:hypothetical protein